MLAESGALKGLSGHRHRARWAIVGAEAPLPLFDGVDQTAEPDLAIPLLSFGEHMVAYYAMIGLTLGKHPLSLIRKQLTTRKCLSSADLENVPHGKRVVRRTSTHAPATGNHEWRDLRDARRRTRHGQRCGVEAHGRGTTAGVVGIEPDGHRWTMGMRRGCQAPHRAENAQFWIPDDPAKADKQRLSLIVDIVVDA